MQTVYFVRHGSTEGNEGNMYQQPETPLSKSGLEQAATVARRFETISADIVISSDMSRALMTAEVISKHNHLKLEINPLFQEILRPSVVRGRLQDDPEVKKIMDEVKARYDDESWHHSDEENFHDLKRRGKLALEHLYGRTEDSIVVTTHGHILRLMMGLLIMGDDLTSAMYKRILKTFFIANTGITMCKMFEGKLTLHTWNDHEHLGEILD